jgi:hypothetical protein
MQCQRGVQSGLEEPGMAIGDCRCGAGRGDGGHTTAQLDAPSLLIATAPGAGRDTFDAMQQEWCRKVGPDGRGRAGERERVDGWMWMGGQKWEDGD